MIEFKDEVLQKKIVVHCDEEWKAENLLKWADSKGLKWVTGGSCLEKTNWNYHKCETCYSLSEGKYSDKDFYDSHGYKVISYEQAIKMKEKIIQIAIAGHENTNETQSSFTMMALTEDGRILVSQGWSTWEDFTPDKDTKPHE